LAVCHELIFIVLLLIATQCYQFYILSGRFLY
jgi:hypothetical protein